MSGVLADLLSLRPSGAPCHIFRLDGPHYVVEEVPAGMELPAFWWRARGRILQDTVLRHAEFHAVVTFFQFYAMRQEVFQTAHVQRDHWSIVARSAEPEAARAAHQGLVKQIEAALPAQAALNPSWT
ncbi:hypothetical protein [Deinococcus multiflagellatus]|uniref:Uncharacterized protein n=1 Tax=Deinococcus multiflagellatus TaxID=1656887 RepID=A0ABW1ZUV7_9DEIO|nr:hypothetical protein [Deinococcus multiflagellatus]MBZ9714420.1 hypothetical protein [Deinococcus multiflagellatus]